MWITIYKKRIKSNKLQFHLHCFLLIHNSYSFTEFEYIKETNYCLKNKYFITIVSLSLNEFCFLLKNIDTIMEIVYDNIPQMSVLFWKHTVLKYILLNNSPFFFQSSY